MVNMVTHTEAGSFEISKHKNLLEKPSSVQTLLISLEFVINLKHNIAVSNLARS